MQHLTKFDGIFVIMIFIYFFLTTGFIEHKFAKKEKKTPKIVYTYITINLGFCFIIILHSLFVIFRDPSFETLFYLFCTEIFPMILIIYSLQAFKMVRDFFHRET